MSVALCLFVPLVFGVAAEKDYSGMSSWKDSHEIRV